MMKNCSDLRKKAVFILLFALLALIPAFGQNQSLKTGDYYTLSLLNTHDIHGQIADLPKYATLIDQVRSEAKNLLVLDCGDIFRRGPYEQFQGQLEMSIFNQIGYDAWVLGNHEFTVPKPNAVAADSNEQITRLVKMAKFPTLCANVIMNSTGKPMEGVLPYTIKNIHGVRVGIIGVTSLKPQDRKLPEVCDKTFLDASAVLAQCLKEIDNQIDIAVCISHAGMNIDLVLMKNKKSKLVAILGADTHLSANGPLYWQNDCSIGIPVFQHGGEKAHTLARMDVLLQKTHTGFNIVNVSTKIYTDLKFIQADARVQNIIDEWTVKAVK